MKRSIDTLFLLILLFAAAGGAVGQELAVIDLKHRTAEEIIPIIRPLLGPGDTLSGQRFVIFVTTRPDNLQRIKAIVEKLDQALRQLMITVVQGARARESLASVDISGNVSAGGNADIKFGRNPQPDDTVTVTDRRKTTTQNDVDIQTVRTQEGRAATIYIGQSRPVTVGENAAKVVYREVMTGFKMTPRLSGDRFVLEIAAQQESTGGARDGVVAVQQIQTQIGGRLNAWVDIGAVTRQRRQRDTGVAYRDSGSTGDRRQVFLRIVAVE